MSQLAELSHIVPDQFERALLESRQRWRDFGAIAADIVFELDGTGRVRFLAPDTVLGWKAAELLGRQAAGLLWAEREPGSGFIRFGPARRKSQSWVRRADGEEVCLGITLTPQFDGQGQCIGARGVGVDVTAREEREQRNAAALRRAEVLDHLLDQMRQEVLAPRMMAAMLTALVRAAGSRGAAVLDLGEPPELASVIQETGNGIEKLLPDLLAALREDGSAAPRVHFVRDRQVLACPATTRFGHETALVLWREAGGPAWHEDDCMMIASVTGLVRIVLEHESIQRELARQARTDSLTGLLNRRAFIDEAKRRIDRLERDGQPGTLMFIDLDRFKQLNDRLGHEAGDNALIHTATILRRVVRPADLVARLGGDEFAIWLDGFDDLSAAERAEHLRLCYPHALQQLASGEDFELSLSIGIACRQPGSGEELEDIVQRADRVMYEVKRGGRGAWRVSHRQQLV